jgi:predicted RNA-binding Zn ribbon-like protein
VLFTHDTEVALSEAAALVNTVGDDGDHLTTRAALDAFLARQPFSGEIVGDEAELVAVQRLRPRLRAFWSVEDRDEAAGLVNALLADCAQSPYLSKHDAYDWHLHVTRPDAPLADRIGAEAAMGFLDLVRADALSRLRTCAADDCSAVLVDLSRNHSKRYCATGNCGNRANVAAYRARKRTSA